MVYAAGFSQQQGGTHMLMGRNSNVYLGGRLERTSWLAETRAVSAFSAL
jgi:hypothetical protein